MRNPLVPVLLAGALVVTGAVAPVAAAERSEIPEKYTWNLADLYPTESAWIAAKDDALKRIPGLAAFKGHLGDSAETLFNALSATMALEQDLSRLRAYASQLHDQDTRVGRSLEMRQVAEQAVVSFQTATSFVRPEILALDESRVKGFIESEPRLQDYKFYLEDILRWKPHTLNADEEKIVARTGDFAGAGESIRSIFTNAELPYPEVTLSTGEKVRLDAAAYTKHRGAASRADRDKVFEAFWTEYQKYRRTLAAALHAQVKAHIFNKGVHKFESSLAASLFDFNIPTGVYRQLIQDVHANLPTLHRYLKLRQRMMGVDRLRYEDLYAPIVKDLNQSYTPEQAMELILKASAPLGADYVGALKKGFESRWVDFFPTVGKRSGAYSESTYDVHPYLLVNYMGQYDDVSMLAHESGHAMHSNLANRSQPYVTHGYSTFVAEVASTLNENLLFRTMARETKDDNAKLALLGNHLELLRGTLFRQTMFAEFELEIHEMAEKGEPLTADNLNRIYLGLVRDYYGDSQGVCQVKDLYAVEWAYIPHFFWNFYVYQYATSLLASISISDGILEEAAAASPTTRRRDAYLNMLSSGSSKYPITLLKETGVDITTSKPFGVAMKEMNQVMDEMEAILDRTRNP